MTVEPKIAQQADTMRDDWNERARQNAFLYIASWRKDWNEAFCFASGEQDYLAFVAPVLPRVQFDPQMLGKTWRVVALTSSDVNSMVRSAGAATSAFLGENAPLAWCYGKKQSQELA